jgi:mannobiose 2-epimerase
MTTASVSRRCAPPEWRAHLRDELVGNILPFWMRHTPDPVNGGFYGALTNDLQVRNDQPRSAVLVARILWTYAAACRLLGDPAYLDMARRAYDYLVSRFWDRQYGGVYWAVDASGAPLVDRKHSYAQAFAIYGLAEYHRATGEAGSLELAQRIFALLDAHSRDAGRGGRGGFVEGCSRDWGALDDMRLSDKEPNCRKSMNTLLHLMEAYANLARAWDDAAPRARLRELIGVFFDHVVDPDTHHFRLFFDAAWRWQAFPRSVSYGHDIEGSWLLVEAAETLGDEALLAQARGLAVHMAQAVHDEGRDGAAVVYETGPRGTDYERHWWVQAEAMVGFYNAWQISGQPHFEDAACQSWQYIQDHFVDRARGEWFKIVRRDGTPDPGHVKTGPWECPYHHSRACFEMLTRLQAMNSHRSDDESN